jgi:hypothetical protein
MKTINRSTTKELRAASGRQASRPSKPCWDAELRELWLGDVLVVRFRRLAPNQELLLSAFQEQGWVTRIDDPLPKSERDSRERLRDTVKKLNRHSGPIRFHLDGSGQGIFWESAQHRPNIGPASALCKRPRHVHNLTKR